LRTIQSGLNQSFRNSFYLYAKLLTACRGHPATRAACSIYSSNNNVTDLSNRLQASIATWKAELSLNQQAQAQYPLEIEAENDQYYIDRRFKGQINRHIHQNHKGNTQNFEKIKMCFICRNHNCWSTRHTEKEREEARKRFQLNYQRRNNNTGNRAYLSTNKFEEKLEEFIVESEGQDPDKTDIELLDEFHSFTLEDCQEEIFHTTCGSMTSIQARNVTLHLCNQSEEHALIKRITPCTFHIVNSNTPFFLSLNDLDNKRALFDNLRNFFRLENSFKVPI
ncbi:hypothetical protein Golomagni_05508, partial [Golovinomyces magnicellulatus]